MIRTTNCYLNLPKEGDTMGTIIDYAHKKLIYTDENGNPVADVYFDDKLLAGLNKDMNTVLGDDVSDEIVFNVNNEPKMDKSNVFDDFEDNTLAFSGSYYPGYFNNYDGYETDPDPVEADGEGVG